MATATATTVAPPHTTYTTEEWLKLRTAFACHTCEGMQWPLQGLVNGEQKTEVACKCAEKATGKGSLVLITAKHLAATPLPPAVDGEVDYFDTRSDQESPEPAWHAAWREWWVNKRSFALTPPPLTPLPLPQNGPTAATAPNVNAAWTQPDTASAASTAAPASTKGPVLLSSINTDDLDAMQKLVDQQTNLRALYAAAIAAGAAEGAGHTYASTNQAAFDAALKRNELSSYKNCFVVFMNGKIESYVSSLMFQSRDDCVEFMRMAYPNEHSYFVGLVTPVGVTKPPSTPTSTAL